MDRSRQGQLSTKTGTPPLVLWVEQLLAIRDLFKGQGFRPHYWNSLAYILFIVFFIVILLTFPDYGITWDERVQNQYGKLVVKFYSSFFRNREATNYGDLYLYGGLFDSMAYLLNRISPAGEYESRHLLNALFGLAGVIGVFKLGRSLGGPLAGFLAALFLVLTPRYYGHSFNNPKDIPFAVFYLYSIYYMVRSVDFLPRIPRGLVLKLGVFIGLAMGVRVGGMVLLGYLALFLIIGEICRLASGRNRVQSASGLFLDLGVLAARFLVIGAVAYGVMLIFWPWGQVKPLVNPFLGLFHLINKERNVMVLFEGRQISSLELPWYYTLRWLSITLPSFVMAGLILGPLVGLWRFRDSGGKDRTKSLLFLGRISVIVLGIVFPLCYMIYRRVPLYDEVRHMLFVIPPIIVLSSLAIATLFVGKKSRIVIGVTAALVLCSVSFTLLEMVRLHPNQYIFFNDLFGGGLQKAAGLYETDYWGNSYKVGAEWLVAQQNEFYQGRTLKVTSCSDSLSTSYYLPADRFEYVEKREDADIFLATTRFNCHNTMPGRIIHVVMVNDVPILYIKIRR